MTLGDTAPRDANQVPALLGTSSTTGKTVTIYADPTTHRLLVDLPGGTGSVTSVSVVSANGFAGTVANATTTPAITISTGITGVLVGNGTAISAAISGTDLKTVGGTSILGSGDISVGSGTITKVGNVTSGAAFDGTAGITLTSLTTATNTFSILAGQPAGANDLGNDIAITASNGGATSGRGGNIAITSGDATGGTSTGGGIVLKSGVPHSIGKAGGIVIQDNSGSNSFQVGYTITGIANPAVYSGGGAAYFDTSAQTQGRVFAFPDMAGTFVIKNSNGNAHANNFESAAANVVSGSSGGTTVLTAADAHFQILTGTLPQTFQLPVATTLVAGHPFDFNNNSSGVLTVVDSASGAVAVVPAGGYVELIATDVSTSAGVFDKHFLMPANASYGTSSMQVSGSFSATTVLASGALSITVGTASSHVGAIIYKNASNTNTLTVQTGATSTSYTITYPIAVASAGQVLTDVAGNGVLSWATPAVGTVTAVSIATANGVSGSSSGGATPALTIALGAITPTSVNGTTFSSGSGTMTFPNVTDTVAVLGTAQSFTAVKTNTTDNRITPQTVTVTSNAGTCDINHGIQNFTNSSASAMTITLTTTSAVDGQRKIVRIYDASAATKGITWVGTENSAAVTAPATSAGSTSIPLTVGFMFNGVTSLWTCLASA